MENLEKEETCTPEVEQEVAQPVAELVEEAADSFYHGAGIGQVEVTGTQEPQQEAEPQAEPEPQLQAAEKPKKKGKLLRKVLKVSVAAVLILALVAGGCFLAVQLCNRYWYVQFALLRQSMREQYAVLQSQIDTNKPPAEGGGTLSDPEGTLSAAQIYQQNVRSVVAINCLVRVTENDKVSDKAAAGTGFIITQDGYIVTNHHVIEGANKVTVTLHNGQNFIATVIGSNDTNDVAVIKIQAQGLEPVTLGTSNQMQVGDQVVAIGNALGEFTASLTVGYVSGMDRDVSTDGTVINMIQTDVAINSGNSGGPLFNARGEVIGITTAKYSGTSSSGASIEGISFAIPMDDVIDMITDLRDFGYIRSAYLGVMCWEVDANVAMTYNLPRGVYVEGVTPGHCAEKAGVQPKDIIVELGGYRIETMNDLSRALRNLDAGSTVTIAVWRGGREILLSITLDEKPAD